MKVYVLEVKKDDKAVDHCIYGIYSIRERAIKESRNLPFFVHVSEYKLDVVNNMINLSLR